MLAPGEAEDDDLRVEVGGQPGKRSDHVAFISDHGVWRGQHARFADGDSDPPRAIVDGQDGHRRIVASRESRVASRASYSPFATGDSLPYNFPIRKVGVHEEL